MNAEEERLVFLVESGETLCRALAIFKEATNSTEGILRDAAIEMALIEYAKPYKVSRGNHGKLTLSADRVPEKLKVTHECILRMRDQFLAHSDMKPRDAVLSLRDHKGMRVRAIMQTYIKPIYEVGGIDAVVSLIESVLPGIYEEAEALEVKLRGG